jgi:5'-nucleotidase
MPEHETAGAVPRVLVTNDDGIDSEGLPLLARAARRAGYDVVIVAPDCEASGSGTAMSATQDGGRIVTGSRRLAGLEAVPAYSVPAAPAFIVFMAMQEAFGRKPDIVLSGINDGPNTGRAILHSGTVGAALTAAVSGVRAAAFSQDTNRSSGDPQWETAEDVARRVIGVMGRLPQGHVLNVNVPDLPLPQLHGIRQGHLAAAGAVQASLIERSEHYLRVGMSGPDVAPAPGTDAAILAGGFASVTLLTPFSEPPAPWLPWPQAGGSDITLADHG